MKLFLYRCFYDQIDKIFFLCVSGDTLIKYLNPSKKTCLVLYLMTLTFLNLGSNNQILTYLIRDLFFEKGFDFAL